MKQLLAEWRKWQLDFLDRGGIAALTERVSRVTESATIDEMGREAMANVLDF